VYLISAYAPPNDLVLIDVAARNFEQVGNPQITEKGLSILPDGTTLYAINLEANKIMFIDCATNQVAGEITPPGDVNLNTTAMAPDGKFLYVSAADEVKDAGLMLMIDTAKKQFVGKPTVFDNNYADAIAMAPDGKTIYTANLANDTVTVVAIEQQ
jgi:YVTN family beta-propeller protein